MIRKISGKSKSPSFTHLNIKRGTKATSKKEIANTLGETFLDTSSAKLFWILLHLGIIQRSFKTSMMMMMSSGLTTHQPMRVICVKMVN